MKITVFDIKGMSCSACAAHIDKAVCKLKGVVSVQVNLLTNSMSVRYDEAVLDVTTVEEAVKKAGYTAVARQKEEQHSNTSISKKQYKSNVKTDTELLSMKRQWQKSLFFLFPLLYVSMGEMLGLPLPDILKGHQNILGVAFLQFLFSLPIYSINKKYFTAGFRSLVKLSPNMDSLIAIGSSASMFYGIYIIFRIGYGIQNGKDITPYMHDLYFESGATILTLITLGKYFEAKSKSYTSEALTKLMNLSPQTAVVTREGKELEIPVEQVIAGDMVVIKSGQSIPVDGNIISGYGSIDESALTGESIPVFKKPGDPVISAAVCQTGYFIFQATKVGEDTTLSQIIRLVEEASASKAPIARLADRISGFFVPVVITIAAAATVIWLVLGYPVDFALTIGVSVLVISCPCALGLATPVAIMAGTGKAASHGILVKSAESFETAYKIDTIVMDKTGTLTAGQPSMTKIISGRFFPEQKLLEIAASLEKPSEHPLAKAILDEAEFRSIQPLPVSDYEVFPGMGIKAKINDREYFAGNISLMKAKTILTGIFAEQADSLSKSGNTLLFIANSKEVLGIIAVADILKPHSAEAVAQLQQMGLDVVMLTGDQFEAAQRIQQKLGIKTLIAGILPQGKEKEIRKLQSQGKKVAMVGDGINDAPALTRADLGIAIGAGTDIAMESADVILINNDLSGVSSFIRLSKKIMLNIKQNLFWAFFYNILGIPLAAGLFYSSWGLKLNPMFAAAAMSLSSITVVLNALRIKSNKEKGQK